MIDTKPPKKIFKHRRCQNCNKLYLPTREDQKFCRTLPDRDKCRKEFYRYGSSYGPLKTGLHKAIDKKCAEMQREVRLMRAAMALLDGDFKKWREQIELLLVERAQADAQTQAR